VKQTDEVATQCVIDRLAGATVSIIKQAMKEGELTSAVIIFSTASGRVTALVIDESPKDGCGIQGAVAYQVDKLACQTMATVVASSLGEKVISATRKAVSTES
jgi:hypothetical protein